MNAPVSLSVLVPAYLPARVVRGITVHVYLLAFENPFVEAVFVVLGCL